MTGTRIDNECPLCGAAAREVNTERDIAYGPDKRVRVPAPEMRCRNCGATFTTATQLQIADERAAAIVRSTGRILGFEIRRIRARLGLTQAQLEETLGLGSKTVTRWERDLVELEGPTVSILRALEAGKLDPRDVMALRTGGGSSEREAGPGVAPEVCGAAEDDLSRRRSPRRAWLIREE